MKSLALALALALLLGVVCIDASFVNKNVQRSIDLTTHTPRISLQITVTKKGGSGDYQLEFPESVGSKIAWIEAADEDGNELKIVADAAAAHKDRSYKVALGGATKFSVSIVLTHAMTPLPKKIAQSDQQQVLYEDDHFFYSPYETENQRTEVKLASSSVEHHSEEKPTIVRGDTVVYGPYENKAAHSRSAMRLHFVHNAPFYAVTTLLKEIEVSLWGNVAVEEHYDLRHTGAELKGFFSRLDLQRNPTQNAISSIRHIKAELPPHAQDIYYRDVIGNISTSHVRESDTGPEFEIIPRFPLFGGWKTQFYFGYNLPLPSYVAKDDNGRYHLNITYGSPLQDVVVDDMTVKIILPEGSSNFKVVAPFDAGVQSEEVRFTYLDRTGRPVVVLKKSNVVADHDVFFQVSFDFTGIFIWHEPALLIIGFFSIFAVCILRTRLFDNSGSDSDSK